MKIILCSEKDSIRERWRSILSDQGYLIYQAALVEGLKQLIRPDDTYLFLVHQPFADFGSIRKICDSQETCKILVLADNPDEKEGISLLIQGGVGYANTYIAAGQLREAVKTIFSGRVWFSQSIMNELIHAINLKNSGEQGMKENRLPEVLSEREKEIALLVSEGMSNNSIAEKLYISERTVKTHLGTIFNKTGIHSRLQLALLVLRKE